MSRLLAFSEQTDQTRPADVNLQQDVTVATEVKPASKPSSAPVTMSLWQMFEWLDREQLQAVGVDWSTYPPTVITRSK